MLDLHTHVLPGLDDGAVDLAAGVALCRRLHEQGITTVVATPHWHSPRFDVEGTGIAQAWDVLRAAVATEMPGLTLVLGAEHHCSGLEDPAAFVTGCRPLGDSRVVLVELPDDHLPANAWGTLFALIRAGRRPVLAHPERCRPLRRQRDQVAAFVEAGGLLQLTLGHLLGIHGWRMRWHGRGLLRRYPKSCLIASDSHDLGVRRPQWDRLPAAWGHLVPVDLAAVSAWGGINI
jgi:protein-tyrosine phosphatase